VADYPHVKCHRERQNSAGCAAKVRSTTPVGADDLAVQQVLQIAHARPIPAPPHAATTASNRLVNWKPEYNSNGYTWNAWEWDLR
jgi:hypothetical protein